MLELKKNSDLISIVHDLSDIVSRSLSREIGDSIISTLENPDVQNTLSERERGQYEKAKKTFQNLKNEFDGLLEKPKDLQSLAEKIPKINQLSKDLVLLLEAWKQRLKGLEQNLQPLRILKAIQEADVIVKALYCPKKVDDQIIDLDFESSPPIVVPFMTHMRAVNLDSPMPPIIVAPIWGYQQIWTWLGYAHEVGHHIYRNIKGLCDELRVRVMLSLTINNIGYEVQNIWFNWLEEVFADVFGLLRIGSAVARSQQLMLLCLLATESIQQSKVNKPPVTDQDIIKGLLQASDDTHPSPYLRALITYDALKMIGEKEDIPSLKDDAKALYAQWTEFFNDISQETTQAQEKKVKIISHVRWLNPVLLSFQTILKTIVDAIAAALPGSMLTPQSREFVEKPIGGDMEKASQIVLEVILNTPLDALRQRNMREVFFDDLTTEELSRARNVIGDPEQTKPDIKVQALLATVQEKLEELLNDPNKPPDIFDQLESWNDNILDVIEKLKESETLFPEIPST